MIHYFHIMRFELYTNEKKLTAEFWKAFIEKITKRIDYFDHWTLELAFTPNQLLFFIESKKDFSGYANELAPFIIRWDKEYKGEQYPQMKSCYVDFSTKVNIIRLKEREQLRMNRTLKGIRWHFYHAPVSYSELEMFFVDGAGKAFRCKRRFVNTRWNFLDLDLSESIQYKPKEIPLYVQVQKTVELLSDDPAGALLSVPGFPYFQEPKYLPLNKYSHERHGLVLGQTGTGKSRYLSHFIRQLELQGITETHTVVILDPHAALYTDFSDNAAHANVDFVRTACQLFAQFGEPTLASELTILLFKTLMKEQFNPKAERVLKYTLFTLFTGGMMSLETLRKFLTDVMTRKEVLMNTKIAEGIQIFFDTEFGELQTKFYQESILPILTLLDELAFLPITNFETAASLGDLVDNHSLVFLSLDRTALGQKATKLIAGLLIQQIFLLAQSGKLKKKIMFLIDEVSVVQNEALAAILSEARKFGLSLTLSQQYLQQIDTFILQSVITNVSNYVIFKVSEEDANDLANNLEFSFPEELFAASMERAAYEKHLKVKMMTELNPRECLVRVFSNDKFYPMIKARTIDT